MTAGVTYRVLDAKASLVGEYDNEFYAKALAKVLGGTAEEILSSSPRVGSSANRAPVERELYFVMYKASETSQPFISSIYRTRRAAEESIAQLDDDEIAYVEVHTIKTFRTQRVKKVYILLTSDTPDDFNSFSIKSLHTSRGDAEAAGADIIGHDIEYRMSSVINPMVSTVAVVDNKFAGFAIDQMYVISGDSDV